MFDIDEEIETYCKAKGVNDWWAKHFSSAWVYWLGCAIMAIFFHKYKLNGDSAFWWSVMFSWFFVVSHIKYWWYRRKTGEAKQPIFKESPFTGKAFDRIRQWLKTH